MPHGLPRFRAMVSVRAQSGQGWVLLLGDGSKVDKSLGSLIRRRRKGRGLFSLAQRWETRFQRAAVGGPGVHRGRTVTPASWLRPGAHIT